MAIKGSLSLTLSAPIYSLLVLGNEASSCLCKYLLGIADRSKVHPPSGPWRG